MHPSTWCEHPSASDGGNHSQMHQTKRCNNHTYRLPDGWPIERLSPNHDTEGTQTFFPHIWRPLPLRYWEAFSWTDRMCVRMKCTSNQRRQPSKPTIFQLLSLHRGPYTWYSSTRTALGPHERIHHTRRVSLRHGATCCVLHAAIKRRTFLVPLQQRLSQWQDIKHFSTRPASSTMRTHWIRRGPVFVLNVAKPQLLKIALPRHCTHIQPRPCNTVCTA